MLTVRVGQVAPDAATGLWKDGVLPWVEVEPLSEEATTRLLERVAGRPGAVHHGLAPVHRDGGQRPVAAPPVQGERAGGRLRCVERVWHWLGEPELGPALSALIGERIGGQPPDLREVIELLGLGESLTIDVLRTMCGEPALEGCADRALITLSPDGRLWTARLAHPLYGEAVRARLSTLRGRRLRGRLVHALRTAGEGGDELRLAVLALDSDLPPDPALLLAAANKASLLTDMDLTERLVAVAYEAGGRALAELLAECGGANTPGAARGRAAVADQRPAAGDRPDGGGRAVQPGDRRPPECLGPHGGGPHLSRVHQAGVANRTELARMLGHPRAGKTRSRLRATRPRSTWKSDRSRVSPAHMLE